MINLDALRDEAQADLLNHLRNAIEEHRLDPADAINEAAAKLRLGWRLNPNKVRHIPLLGRQRHTS